MICCDLSLSEVFLLRIVNFLFELDCCEKLRTAAGIRLEPHANHSRVPNHHLSR